MFHKMQEPANAPRTLKYRKNVCGLRKTNVGTSVRAAGKTNIGINAKAVGETNVGTGVPDGPQNA